MRWLFWVVLTLFLAGCAGDEAPDETTGNGTGEDAAAVTATLEMPEWAVGHYWTYTIPGGSFTYVVGERTSNDWIMETDNLQTAFFHAQDPISMLGEIRSSDLAGSQGTDRVLFFDWPLRDGKVWKTPWDGRSWTMQAHVQDGVAHVIATGDDVVGREFTYSSDAGWFTSMTFYDDDGSEMFTMELQDHGTGWAGEVYRYHLDTIIDTDVNSAVPQYKTYVVAAGITDIWAQVSLTCEGNPGTGQVVLAPADPAASDNTIHADLQCPTETVDTYVVPAVSGDLAVTADLVHDSGNMHLLAYARTLETITI